MFMMCHNYITSANGSYWFPSCKLTMNVYIDNFPRGTVGFPHLYVYPGVIVDETFVLRCDNVARG